MEKIDENFLDAYELIDCQEPKVKEFVQSLPVNLGRPVPIDDYLREYVVTKIGKLLDKVPVQNLSIDDILKLNNLDNMPEDMYTLQNIKRISGKEGYKEVYIEEMEKRDKRDYRDREFPLEPILEAVELGTCRPPLILELDNEKYVIDGRTRIYAALAANKSLNATVAKPETFGGLYDKN